jgi:hypothetical protein
MELLGEDKTGSNTFMGAAVTNQKKPTEQVNPKEQKVKPWAPWGNDNKYPQNVLDNISDVSLVSPILDWKARALYGSGLAYGLLHVDEKGQEHFTRVIDPEIEDWLEATDVQQYIMEASTYFYHFYNIFPELIQSVDGSKIVYLSCLESTDCRWGRREQSGKLKGQITKAYVNPDWKAISNVDDMTVIDVLNTRMDPLNAARQWKNKKFIYPVSYPSPGRSYYQKAPWHVLLNTWLPVAKEIPEFKKALLENQISMKYLMLIPDHWWEFKYPDWNKKSEKDRLAIYQREMDFFNNFFSGAENSGKSLVVTTKSDDNMKKYKDWQIDPIDNKIKEGMYLEDSQEADAHIYKNLNVDPTLFGAGAGKNSQSSGSGSDKRVAWNNYILMTKPHQDLILKPLPFISRYNGWAQRIERSIANSRFTFWFKNYMIAKLDSGAETQSTDESTPQ